MTMGSQTAGAIFVLGLIGFGFKAGFPPLHVWLPGAHANAPSHVSALMSGVMLKMGIYGIVRMTGLLPSAEAWMGAVLLGLGAFAGLAGIAFAVGQQDIKRALAYSSIENVGIIAMGLGLALLGRALEKTGVDRTGSMRSPPPCLEPRALQVPPLPRRRRRDSLPRARGTWTR